MNMKWKCKLICSFIVVKCYSYVTKLIWFAVKIFATINLVFITTFFKWKNFVCQCNYMSLRFFKIHDKTFKRESWTFNENQNDDQMRWVFVSFFFFHNSRYESLYYLTWFIYKDNIIIWNIYSMWVSVALLYAFTR